MDPTELNNQEDVYGQPGGEQPIENQQAAPVVEEVNPAAEPEDLAAAFAALRGNDNGAAGSPVGNAEGEQGNTGNGVATVQGSVSNVSNEQYGNSGESAIDLSGFDPNAYGQQVLGDIRQLVIQSKRKEWNDKGYKPFSVQDLARRDERTGRIFYVNPDDGQQEWERPGYQGFDREKAAAWVNSFNQELNQKWKQECSELEKEYVKQAMPLFQLAAFAPTYQSMNAAERDIVDELTEPYAIRNSNGDVIGFSCNLNQMAATAKNLAAKYNTASQVPAKQQQQNTVRQPVTDARSSVGSVSSGPQKTPTDISDAIAMFEQMQKDQRKANKK